ncbi:MAG: CDP-alcohol phosphatidyltransferase family protein [Nocardioidaceae bacterium]
MRDSARRECAETNSTKGTTLTTHEATLESPRTTSAGLRLAGIALHFYTATGTVFGFLVVVAAFQGAVERALWLALVALIIDGTDGMAARWLRVSETIPSFDGARLDDIVDYLTYAFAPMVLLWTTGRLPEGATGQLLAGIPLLASTYQFCRTDAKTADHFFLGFPSYWNVVAFYVYVLDLGTTVTAVILLACSILVFVPIRYVYPSRTEVYRGLNIAFTALWLATYAILLVQRPDPQPVVVALSFAYLVYYAGLSLYLTLVLPRLPAKRLSKDAIAAELDD